MNIKDNTSNYPSQLLLSGNGATATGNSSSIDTAPNSAVNFEAFIGTLGSGANQSYKIKVQVSANNSTFTDSATADVIFPNGDTLTGANQWRNAIYTGSSRYVRLVVTATSGVAGTIIVVTGRVTPRNTAE